jgi:hypothetical protein
VLIYPQWWPDDEPFYLLVENGDDAQVLSLDPQLVHRTGSTTGALNI